DGSRPMWLTMVCCSIVPSGLPAMLARTGNAGFQSDGFTQKLPTQLVVTENLDCESSSSCTVTLPTPTGAEAVAGPKNTVPAIENWVFAGPSAPWQTTHGCPARWYCPWGMLAASGPSALTASSCTGSVLHALNAEA